MSGGGGLGEVLETHAATFTVIASVPAELAQHGREPPLSVIDRSLLFSIAHNALTNVIRHAHASRVVIGLDCTREELRLSVSDDGAGLPPGYEARGHGFRNMRADAERMGGSLEVESDGDGGGTTVTCVVPCRNLRCSPRSGLFAARADQQALRSEGVQPRRLALGPAVAVSRLTSIAGFPFALGVVSEHRFSATPACDQPVQR